MRWTVRHNTNRLLELVEDGLIDKDYLINELLANLSEDAVTRMMQINAWLDDDAE